MPNKRAGDPALPLIDVNPFHRYPLIVINLVVMTASGLLMAVCAYSLFVRWDELRYVEASMVINLVVNLEVPILTVSSLVFLLGTVGFIGALRENIRLLRYYSCTVSSLEVVAVLVAVVFLVGPLLATNPLHAVVSVELIEHYRDNLDFQALIDYIQTTFECCGVTDGAYRDWNRNIYFNCSKTNPSVDRCSVPSSCCSPQKGKREEPSISRRYCGQNALLVSEQQAWNKVYTRSCVSVMMSMARSYSLQITAGSVVATIVLAVVRTMSNKVCIQVNDLTKLYEEYYAEIRRGVRRKFARERALRNIPMGCVVLSPVWDPSVSAPAMFTGQQHQTTAPPPHIWRGFLPMIPHVPPLFHNARMLLLPDRPAGRY